jgi:hypothetical protein
MISPPEQRPTIEQIRDRISNDFDNNHSMNELIASLKHRERPSPSEAIQYKIGTSWAYQHLGLWN